MTTITKRKLPKLLILTEKSLLTDVQKMSAKVRELRQNPDLSHEVWESLFRAEIALTCVEDGLRKMKGRALISSFEESWK